MHMILTATDACTQLPRIDRMKKPTIRIRHDTGPTLSRPADSVPVVLPEHEYEMPAEPQPSTPSRATYGACECVRGVLHHLLICAAHNDASTAIDRTPSRRQHDASVLVCMAVAHTTVDLKCRRPMSCRR